DRRALSVVRGPGRARRRVEGVPAGGPRRLRPRRVRCCRESMAHPNELDALYAFLLAAAVTALLTPVTMRLARALGAIDEPRERGLSERPTPLLGGLAIFAGALVAALIWLPGGYKTEHQLWHGVLIAAAV